jgi:hypothetical protein
MDKMKIGLRWDGLFRFLYEMGALRSPTPPSSGEDVDSPISYGDTREPKDVHTPMNLCEYKYASRERGVGTECLHGRGG